MGRASKIKMERFLFHLFSLIVLASLTHGFSIPEVNVRLIAKGIQFSLQEKVTDDISNAKMLIFASKNIINNSKFVESELKRDDSGKWSLEIQNILLDSSDVIEYWLFVEHAKLGYSKSRTMALKDIPQNVEIKSEKVASTAVHEDSMHHDMLVKILKPSGVQFSMKEDTDAPFDSARIFIFSPKAIMNNSKYIESDMKRDESGMWIYEMPSVVLNSNDIVEYWLYAEKSNLGYFTNQIFRVQDIIPPSEELTTTTTTEKITTVAATSTLSPVSTSATTTPSSTVCEASVSTVNGKAVGCKNSIIFNEDFNSDNLSYWSFDTRFPLDDSWADSEFNVYEKRPETSFVRDNVLTIKAESLKRLSGFDDTRIRIGSYNLKQSCTPISNDDRECERQANFGYILPPVTSAYLTTRNKFSFMYGRVQARVKAPIGDYLYAQISLHPTSAAENSSQHLKVFFTRGNEQLKDGSEEVGGSRVYGGAILSKNVKNNLKWLKTKHFPNAHLGNDFHTYELLWSPKEITLSIDGVSYGSLNSNFRESAIQAKIKSAVNWDKNAPFDKEHYLSISVSAGSVKNFYSFNSTLLNGPSLEPKPWNDTDPRAERSFYMAHDKWYPTWKQPRLDVDFIKIYAI